LFNGVFYFRVLHVSLIFHCKDKGQDLY
jgi:hypothetical protein